MKRRLVVALPVLYAVVQGTRQLLAVRPTALDPDAVSYLQIANDFSLETLWGGAREPIWASLLALPVNILGAHATIIRALGVGGFIALVVAFQRAVTRMEGEVWGVVGGFFMAASPWLIYQAPRGLREETAAAGLILVATAATVWRQHHRTSLVVGLFAGAALLALLRWDTLLVTLPTLILVALVRRIPWKKTTVGLFTSMVITAPLLVGNYVQHGDPMFHSNVHAVWFRNVEFAGQSGLATVDELQNEPYGGPYVTWFGYLFDYHSAEEVLRRTVRGTGRILLTAPAQGLFYPETGVIEPTLPTLAMLRSLQVLLVWMFAGAATAGALLAVGMGKDGPWPLAVMWLATLVPLAPVSEIFDWRLAVPAFVFTVLLAIHAAASWQRGARRDEPA